MLRCEKMKPGGRIITLFMFLRNKGLRTFAKFIHTQQMSSSLGPEILIENAGIVVERIRAAAMNSGRDETKITLVAVSKTKPASDIQALYDAGYRHFGENYYQELVEKAALLPPDIKWHFIGHLQSTKANKLIRDVPNLHVLETIDSFKLAGKLNKACEDAGKVLDVYLQVHTSDEDTKSGVSPEDLVLLAQDINRDCPHLLIRGLMTIGAPGDLSCFDKLVQCRSDVSVGLGRPEDSIELSMGMSGDFEAAVQRGSSSVRVGSLIFGERLYRN